MEDGRRPRPGRRSGKPVVAHTLASRWRLESCTHHPSITVTPLGKHFAPAIAQTEVATRNRLDRFPVACVGPARTARRRRPSSTLRPHGGSLVLADDRSHAGNTRSAHALTKARRLGALRPPVTHGQHQQGLLEDHGSWGRKSPRESRRSCSVNETGALTRCIVEDERTAARRPLSVVAHPPRSTGSPASRRR